MTHLRYTVLLPTAADHVWAALADVGAVHRLAPGFVTATTLDGDQRVVTFANGVVAHERIVSVDPDRRRLAYTITDSPAGMTHHHGVFEVEPDGEACTLTWSVDLLPADVAPAIDEMMAAGLEAMAAGFGARASV